MLRFFIDFEDKIKVSFTENCDRLFIETQLQTLDGKKRVVSMEKYSTIVLIEKKCENILIAV